MKQFIINCTHVRQHRHICFCQPQYAISDLTKRSDYKLLHKTPFNYSSSSSDKFTKVINMRQLASCSSACCCCLLTLKTKSFFLQQKKSFHTSFQVYDNVWNVATDLRISEADSGQLGQACWTVAIATHSIKIPGLSNMCIFYVLTSIKCCSPSLLEKPQPFPMRHVHAYDNKRNNRCVGDLQYLQ